jgi:hypothetical protein
MSETLQRSTTDALQCGNLQDWKNLKVLWHNPVVLQLP